MAVRNNGTRSGSNRVGFFTRTWTVPAPTSVRADRDGNIRYMITELYCGAAGQNSTSRWATLGISGNGVNTTSPGVNLSSVSGTTAPPQVTFNNTNVIATSTASSFTFTYNVYTNSALTTRPNNTLESTTPTDDTRLSNVSSQSGVYWGGYEYLQVSTAPTNPALSVSGNTFTYTWGAPNATGDTPITGYVIQHSTSSTFSGATSVNIAANTFTYSVNLTGTRYFRAYAVNAVGNSAYTGSRSATAVAAPTWTTTSLNAIARVGTTFTTTVTASGATSYAIRPGDSIPANLSINNSGVISGTVSAGASQEFRFRVNATNGGGTTTSNEFIINRRQPLPDWGIGADDTLSSDLRVGDLYEDSVQANNATSYVATGLPSGGLSHSSGSVTGTPNTTSSISFSITPRNSDNTSGPTLNFTLTPKPRLASWVDQTLQTTVVKVNQDYEDGVSALYAASYSLHSGTLPPGITLDTTFGGLNGQPTQVGTYEFVLRAQNSINERIFTDTLSITVEPAGSGKVWNGSTWVQAPFKVWNGTTWAEAPAKVWNGTVWTDPVT